jgi:hypothetical protein
LNLQGYLDELGFGIQSATEGASMPIILVNPLNEAVSEKRQPAPRLDTVSGKTIGLLDISKPGGSIFLDSLERMLIERFGVRRIVRAVKPTFTRPAPDQVIESLIGSGCAAVIEALAD